MSGEGKHTIIIIQHDRNFNSRSWLDFNGVNQAMDGIVRLYEHHLKEAAPHKQQISYDVNSLMKFIDDMTDLTALVFDPATNQYAPRDKEWIKSKVYQHLKQQAGH